MTFALVCLPCCTLVDTNVLLYALCWYVQGRLQAVLLCLRYVDTVGIGARFVPSGCAQKKSQGSKKKKKQKYEKKKQSRDRSGKNNFPVIN